ncbi:hypothetical protein [Phycicoccus sp. Soil748]|uniref:hypothetical protein n=1 Tax=Phycicoccus sp. Soil748 TaxID=1736397 RepID=UPI000703A0FD|nr:hypothetical protein [Phycicoccus sp. Soil748]KRE55082.1 hypothetical protein ASG70_06520 [Phycicoccus sp. Soil748]
MPGRPTPLPATLAGRAFSTTQAAAAGLTEGRLRGADLERPFHGVRRVAATAGDPSLRDPGGPVLDVRAQVQADACAAALVLPDDAAFSHCTAALLHGIPLPRSHEHVRPLHVMRPTGRNPVDRPGVTPHLGLQSRHLVVVRGLRLVSMADTWVDLGSLLGVEDLVVAGDRVARLAGSTEPLRLALDRRGRGARGVRGLREALAWVRVGADSAMETRSRLLFCRHGLPEPEVNVAVMAADGSGFLCRGDFVWRERKVVAEYQGAHHFGNFRRGDDDISRRLLVEDDGWKYVELTRSDHTNPARRHALLRRLAAYLGVEVVADRPHPAWTGRFDTTSTCEGGEVRADG